MQLRVRLRADRPSVLLEVCFDSDDICAETYLRAMHREELTNGAKTLASLAAPLELFGYIEFPSDSESVSLVSL